FRPVWSSWSTGVCVSSHRSPPSTDCPSWGTPSHAWNLRVRIRRCAISGYSSSPSSASDLDALRLKPHRRRAHRLHLKNTRWYEGHAMQELGNTTVDALRAQVEHALRSGHTSNDVLEALLTRLH